MKTAEQILFFDTGSKGFDSIICPKFSFDLK